MSRPAERPLLTTGVKVRCYDNGGRSFDRYTVVFCGTASHFCGGAQPYLGMSEHPTRPDGFGQHGEGDRGLPIDRPTSAHLGRRIAFAELPEDCRRLVLRELEDFAACKARKAPGARAQRGNR